MNDLTKVGALLTSDDEAGAEDVPETKDEEVPRSIDEEDEVVDAEVDSWQ